MPASSAVKDLAALERQLRPQGWAVERTRNGHLRFVGPNDVVVTSSSTPSDTRSMRNLKARLKRSGATFSAPTPRRRPRRTPRVAEPEVAEALVLVPHAEPEPEAEPERTPADLSNPMVTCRAYGHAWEPTLPDEEDRAPAFGVLVLMKCLRCESLRRDLVARHSGAVRSRSYVYPEGFHLAGRHERGEFRAEWLDRFVT